MKLIKIIYGMYKIIKIPQKLCGLIPNLLTMRWAVSIGPPKYIIKKVIANIAMVGIVFSPFTTFCCNVFELIVKEQVRLSFF